MTFFTTFAVAFGALLGSVAIMAAWMFRSSGAPLWTKVVVPAAAVALACAAPFRVNDMLGFPHVASLAALPSQAELFAFVTQDDKNMVDLWLGADGNPPRAYEVKLDAKLKKTLREAQAEMSQGRPAMLRKQASKERGHQTRSSGDFSDLPDDQTELMLDESVRSALPPKE